MLLIGSDQVCYFAWIWSTFGNLNPGISTVIFSSTTVMSAYLFWYLYGQKLSVNDYIGTLMMLSSIVIIGYGGSQTDDDGGTDITGFPHSRQFYLYMGLGLSFFAAVNSTIIYISHQQVVRVGCNVEQTNFDCDLIMGLVYLPIFIGLVI